MSCQRSPPSSPRATKIKQQSWDKCNSPPMDLYNPAQQRCYKQQQHHDSPPKSPTFRSSPQQPQLSQPPKSPNTQRKFNNSADISAYYDSTSTRSPSSSNHGNIRSMQNNYNNPNVNMISGSNINNCSPKYENPPRSPKITTTNYANEHNITDNDLHQMTSIGDDSSSSASYYQTPTSGSRSPNPYNNYLSDSRNQSPRRSPNSPRKFIFDAISPTYETQGQQFEYYEPISPETDSHATTTIKNISSIRDQIPTITGGGNSSNNNVNNHIQSRRNSKNFKSRPLISNLSNACNIQTAVSLNNSGNIGNGTNNISSRKDSLTNRYSQQQQHQQQQQQQQQQKQQYHLLDEFPSGNRNLFLKRDSCMTESTQLSGDSCETNNTATTTLSSEVATAIIPSLNKNLPNLTTTSINNSNSMRNNDKSGGAPSVTTNNNAGGRSDPGNFSPISNSANNADANNKNVQMRESKGRRQAINITSNPGYQVLHSSHSTLDRTCSDSVVSLSRCRKSTSDLTNIEAAEDSQPVAMPKPRRRGSSKGGLAYLASRRSSRDSMKSACSNTSIFSNEDIGPLAFQASQRGRQRRTSNFLELPVPDHVRPRVCSLPDRPYNPRLSDDLYRLRHFSISKGTVVNCGDSIISRRSRSNTSVNSTTSRASERSPFDGSCCGGGYANVDSMPPSPTTDSDEPPPPPRYRIVMLGDASVGKTALVSQFMTSEYMHTYDASLDDEFGEKTVSILLDDEESELVFIDHPSIEMSVENSLSTYEPHGCVVAYSVVDRNSFRIAEDIINYLWRENITKDKAVILVGNKADLARSRVITNAEGKNLAASRDVKFIETSSGIQHNVDELLVGTLKQMRLKEKREKKQVSKMKTSRTHISLHLAKELLQKICLTDITKSKSCENLHVL